MPEPVVFTFSLAVLAIPFGVAALAAAGAVLCFATGKKGAGVGAAFVALVAGLVFGPSMLFDRVVVSTDAIEQRTGFVWSQTVKGFRYEDVAHVHVTIKPTGPKRRSAMVWEIHEVDGTTRDIDPGDLWESNSDAIVTILQQHGVEFR